MAEVALGLVAVAQEEVYRRVLVGLVAGAVLDGDLVCHCVEEALGGELVGMLALGKAACWVLVPKWV